jgi:phosphatidylglycerophosphatase A
MFKGGFGVMIDDVAAAFYTLIVLALARVALG